MDGLALARAIGNRWQPVGIVMASGKVRPKAVYLPDRGRFFDKPHRRVEIVAAMRAMAA